MPITLKKIKTITSHRGIWRFKRECSDNIGYIPRQPQIKSPFEFSPTHAVYRDPKGRAIIDVETSHKRYEIFEVIGFQPAA